MQDTVPTQNSLDDLDWNDEYQSTDNYAMARKAMLTQEQWNERSRDLNKLYAVAQVRESSHPQFDGMGYLKWNESNEMADISFLAPKKNKFDTRVTSGITHEKDSSILGMLNGFNYDVNLTIFYKDREMPELSTTATAWIRKARELDHYDEKRPILYRNLIVQGTANASVKWVEEYVPNKVITRGADNNYADADGISWQIMGQKCLFKGVRIELEDGKKVFYEDFHVNDVRKQPGIYIVNYIPRERMKSIWGNSKRWKFVPKRTSPNGTVGAMITQGSIYSDWFFLLTDFTKMEVIEVIRPFENRYQIYINGIPMLENDFPLTYLSPCGLSFIAKGDIDPMNMCAYSKGIPSKTKMDQALYDSLIRIGLIKFEQSAFPPTGNNSGRILSPDIFMPTKLTRNLKAEDLSPLVEPTGVTAGDFSFIKMIQEQIGSKSVNDMLMSGMPAEGQGQMTLGQYMETQRRQLLTLGGIFDGVINWEKQMSHLTFMLLLQHCEADSSNTIVKDTFEDGSKGLRIMRFKNNNVNKPGTKTSSYLHDEEMQYKKETGQDCRITDMDPDQMRAMINNPDYYFYYEIIPVDKNNDKITQAMFVAMVVQAINIFGINSMKVQSLKQEYARVMGRSFDDLFLSDEEQQQQQQQAQQQAAAAAAMAGGGNQDQFNAQNQQPQGNQPSPIPGGGMPIPAGGGAKVSSMYQ